MAAGLRIGVVAICCSGGVLGGCGGTGTLVTVPRSATNSYPVQAAEVLCRAGLEPRFVEVPTITAADPNVNGYGVRSLSPSPGAKVTSGSIVSITVDTSVNGGPGWSGPRLRAVVPDVIGLEVNKALSTVTELGLSVNVAATTPTGSLDVTKETPPAGSRVSGGSTVTLHIGTRGGKACL